jgi:hypothetical protein
MNIVKKILGVVGIVLGAVGILLAIGAIVVVWVVNTPITDGAGDLLKIAETSLVRVDDVLGRTDDGIQEVRNFVSDTAEAIPGTQLAQRVDNLFILVESAAEAADTANQVVGLANKASGLFRRDAEDRPIEKVAATLDELATKLGDVDERAKEFQDRDVVNEVAMQIDSEIAGVQDGVLDINASVGEAQVTVDELQVAVPRWIDIISVVLTLVFLWMAVAQLALAGYGVQWVKGPAEQKALDTEQPPALIEEIEKPAEPALEDAAPVAALAMAEETEKTPDEPAKEEPEVTEEMVRQDLDQDLDMETAGEEE